ncbi:MAG: hypothetical protein IIB56_06025 [Planctomycetes bacterium]|nr:hypothetical protein [Planctomycetota bacterium]
MKSEDEFFRGKRPWSKIKDAVLAFYTKYFAMWVIAFWIVAYLVPKPFVAYRIMNNSAVLRTPP